MIDRVAPPRPQRLAVLATVFMLHAALIALFFFHRTAPAPPPPKPTTIALIGIETPKPAATKPPPPTPPSPVAATFEPIADLAIPTEDSGDAAPGASESCSVPTTILDAVLLDPVVVGAIRSAPPQTRSVAGALVLWNVGWNPATATAADALFVVRGSVERSLAGVADSCLDEPVIGPRMLPVPDGTGEGTIFLVFGSGTWTWRGLLTPPTDGSPVGMAPAPPAPVAATPPAVK
jgi:hypothetical protein